MQPGQTRLRTRHCHVHVKGVGSDTNRAATSRSKETSDLLGNRRVDLLAGAMGMDSELTGVDGLTYLAPRTGVRYVSDIEKCRRLGACDSDSNTAEEVPEMSLAYRHTRDGVGTAASATNANALAAAAEVKYAAPLACDWIGVQMAVEMPGTSGMASNIPLEVVDTKTGAN